MIFHPKHKRRTVDFLTSFVLKDPWSKLTVPYQRVTYHEHVVRSGKTHKLIGMFKIIFVLFGMNMHPLHVVLSGQRVEFRGNQFGFVLVSLMNLAAVYSYPYEELFFERISERRLRV